MYYTTKRAFRLSWRQGLLFAVQDEVNVLFAVLLQVVDQLVEVPVKARRCTIGISNMLVRPVSRMARICSRMVSVIGIHRLYTFSINNDKNSCGIYVFNSGRAFFMTNEHLMPDYYAPSFFKEVGVSFVAKS